MCLRRAPEKYIKGAALDRAGLDKRLIKLRRLSPRTNSTDRAAAACRQS
jgi:hypothetical protein